MTNVPDMDRWKKSSFSSSTDCVEVRGDLGAVRDTKNRAVTLTADMSVLIAAVRSGQLT